MGLALGLFLFEDAVGHLADEGLRQLGTELDEPLVQYLKLEEIAPASAVNLTVQTQYGSAEPAAGRTAHGT